MLVLNRKIGERIKVGDDITLTVIAIDRFGARLGLDAPRGVTILRVSWSRPRPCRTTRSGGMSCRPAEWVQTAPADPKGSPS